MVSRSSVLVTHLSGIRMQMAQQVSDGDRNIARVTARVDELEGVITTNKDLVSECTLERDV